MGEAWASFATQTHGQCNREQTAQALARVVNAARVWDGKGERVR
jgi:hypothetical protein